MFAHNQSFGGKDESVRRGLLYRPAADALANCAAGAAGGDPGRQQPQCLVHVPVHLRVRVQTLLTPENRCQAIKGR